MGEKGIRSAILDSLDDLGVLPIQDLLVVTMFDFALYFLAYLVTGSSYLHFRTKQPSISNLIPHLYWIPSSTAYFQYNISTLHYASLNIWPVKPLLLLTCISSKTSSHFHTTNRALPTTRFRTCHETDGRYVLQAEEIVINETIISTYIAF